MSNIRAEFYAANNSTWVRIKIIGDPNEVERKVKDEDKARFPREWAAFEAGQTPAEPEGMPLTEIEGLTEQAAATYRAKGVRTVEELAALDDGALRGLGMGSLSNRKAAQALVSEKQEQAIAVVVEAAAPITTKRRKSKDA
jgi:hypothetical protein